MSMFFCYGLFGYMCYISAPLYFVYSLDTLSLPICFSFPKSVEVPLAHDGLMHVERILLSGH